MASGVTSLTGAAFISARAPKVTVEGVGVLKNAQVMNVVWRVGASPNQAEISLESRRFHLMEDLTAFATVEITLPVASAGKKEADVTVFVGRITGFRQIATRGEERVVLICQGPRFDLNRDYVMGQRMNTFKDVEEGAGESGKTITSAVGSAGLPTAVVTARPCVFNANGFGNRVPEGAGADTTGVGVFWGDGRHLAGEAYDWTVASMVTYIYAQRERKERREGRKTLAGTVVPNAVGSPLGPTELVVLGTELDDFVHYGLNVEGMQIGDAIHEAIDAAGSHWWVLPEGIGAEGPYGELKAVFKVLDDATVAAEHTKPLHLAEVSSAVFPTASLDAPDVLPIHNVEQLEIMTDYSHVLSGVGIFGAPTVAEGVIIMKPGWNARDELSFVKTAFGLSGQAKMRKIRANLDEASEDFIAPGVALGDPDVLAKPYSGDIGRLFVVDEMGYETDMDVGAGEGADKIEADPTRGFIYTDWGKIGLEGPYALRPRPFLSSLAQVRQIFGAIEKMKTISGDGSGAAGILQRAISGRVMIKHESFTGDLVDLDGSGFKPSNLTFTIEKDRAGIRFNGTPFPEGLMAEQRAGDIDPAGDLLSPFPIAVALLVAVESDWLLGVLGESGLGPATAGFILPEFGGKTYRARKMIRADREYARQGTGVAVTAAVEALGKQAERRQLANSAPSSGANITIPWITTAYYPTDYISHIAGRGSGKLGQIVEVNMDFQAQTTSLTLEDAVLALEQIGSVNSGGE